MATAVRKVLRQTSAERRPGVRERAAQATRDSILRAATKVFARYGYDGATVKRISKSAKSYDRMIYYYFGNKEGLFIAVIEDTYRRFNEAEEALDLDPEQPMEAMKEVIRFIVRYYRDNPEFVTLLNSENLHRGKHVGKSPRTRDYSLPAIGIIGALLRSGVSRGLFRADLSARDLYLLVAAAGYFYQSNRYTLSAFLGENLETPEAIMHWESFVQNAVLRIISPAAATVELAV
jgi:AcrR family transcriptional regulator